MEIKDNIVSLCDHKRQIQAKKDNEIEQKGFEKKQVCDALFVRQHSDDDTCVNNNEFEFSDKE